MLTEIQLPGATESTVGVLGAARFVVRGHLSRSGKIRNRTPALRHFEAYLHSNATTLEPTDDELALASEIEEAATLQGTDLDGGESQLCAMAIMRQSPMVLTGDKRAIRGAEGLQEAVAALSELRGRLVCLEQAIKGIVNRIGLQAVRSGICAEPEVDRVFLFVFSVKENNLLK